MSIYESSGPPLHLTIEWIVPTEIPTQSNLTKVRIYRSREENAGYTLLTTIDAKVNGAYVVSFTDATALDTQRFSYFYLITYYDPTVGHEIETKWFLTFYQFTPREQRLIDIVKQSVSPFIACKMTDQDFRAGLTLSLQLYNTYSPETGYNFNDFPEIHEPLLVYGAEISTLLVKYLNVAITDFNFADSGLSLTLDRGAKIKQAVDNLMNFYKEMLFFAKIEAAPGPGGVGTLQLPVSIGGNLSKGLLNVLDIFNSLGR